MKTFVDIITAPDAATRDTSLDALCRQASTAQLLAECDHLDHFRRSSDNLYQRVRALFFLYAIHRFHLPYRPGIATQSAIPFSGYTRLLRRRFEEAIDIFLAAQTAHGPSTPISSALAAGYRSLGFQTLADQVRRSVRSVRGNQWMFRTGHPADYPLQLRPELLQRPTPSSPFPILHEATPVRMDLSHSGWSDIFFLGMDYPEGARVLNISIDLAVQGSAHPTPKPPVEAYFRIIDRPVIRLASTDLNASVEIRHIRDIFDFASDYLGLLKAALIASGIVPPGMEGATQPLSDLLLQLTGLPGHGIEIVSKVNDIPKGSRLAVSTNLLACLISSLMRATRQISALTGGLSEPDRRLVAARAILGEWLGGSGGGWQDSGGVWPGIKLIHGMPASAEDPEYGISRGCLLPQHKIFPHSEISAATRDQLQQSLVLVHGGMAQDVGPILEMVTEKYLLRSEDEWASRQQAIQILDEVIAAIQHGDIRSVGDCTNRNFAGPIQTIIPWAGNAYTETLIRRTRAEMHDDFYGFWMLGGMAGGGMGFLFSPQSRPHAEQRLQVILRETKQSIDKAVPFAMEPVIYNFAINEKGTQAFLLDGDQALMPSSYYTFTVPTQLRADIRSLSPLERIELARFGAACRTVPEFSSMVHQVFEHLVPRHAEDSATSAHPIESLLRDYGFDRLQHEKIQTDLRHGRIGLAQNRLPASTTMRDVDPSELFDLSRDATESLRQSGLAALASGTVAAVTLAGGIGTRWTKGAGVVKALNPFAKFAGHHRSFIEVHLAKSRRIGNLCGTTLPHIITTSYLTHSAIESYLRAANNYAYPGPVVLSPGRSIGLRLVPMERDLRFAWEESPQQLLDEQAQKVRQSLHASLIQWAKSAGEGANYTDNLPLQCLHPIGHWYEIPNLLRNGVLADLLDRHPNLRHLMIHNIDTVGADLDPALLGYHLQHGAAMTTEVIPRHLEDRGGGLTYVDGHLRLVEGLAFPDEAIESRLSYYNSATYWIDIQQLLAVFGLTRADLRNEEKVTTAVRALAARMPTYVTLKDVKKRWGKGQEDIFPVAQFEKLWGDMTALPDWPTRFAIVPRTRGQQLKEPAQLDGWLRDGSAAFTDSLCEW